MKHGKNPTVPMGNVGNISKVKMRHERSSVGKSQLGTDYKRNLGCCWRRHANDKDSYVRSLKENVKFAL